MYFLLILHVPWDEALQSVIPTWNKADGEKSLFEI